MKQNTTKITEIPEQKSDEENKPEVKEKEARAEEELKRLQAKRVKRNELLNDSDYAQKFRDKN